MTQEQKEALKTLLQNYTELGVILNGAAMIDEARFGPLCDRYFAKEGLLLFDTLYELVKE